MKLQIKKKIILIFFLKIKLHFLLSLGLPLKLQMNWIISIKHFIEIIRIVALYSGLLHCVFGNGNDYIGNKSLCDTYTIAKRRTKSSFVFMMAQTYLTLLYRSWKHCRRPVERVVGPLTRITQVWFLTHVFLMELIWDKR